MSERFAAIRFDGRTAEAHAASLWIEGADLVIESGGGERRVPIASARIAEPFERAPRMICAGGESYEVAAGQGFARALEASGVAPSPVVRMQRNAQAATGALALLLVSFALAYVYGVPLVARWAAHATPYAVQERLGAHVLEVLDRSFLEPSALPLSAIEVRFARAAEKAAPDRPIRLLFRSVRANFFESSEEEEEEGEDGAPEERDHEMINAFALPGGTIVVLDGLVEAASEDQLFAVLGHELGHVVHDHAMQSAYRNASVAALAGLAWGDFSGIAAGIPAALGMLRYSRELEDEADAFAVRVLADAGLDAMPLCGFLMLIIEHEAGTAGALPEFLSSHPDTVKRAARLCPE